MPAPPSAGPGRGLVAVACPHATARLWCHALHAERAAAERAKAALSAVAAGGFATLEQAVAFARERLAED